ncbi:unnamed protein product, partial [Ixodes pacificus]
RAHRCEIQDIRAIPVDHPNPQSRVCGKERQTVGLTGATCQDAALTHCTFAGATMPSVGVRLAKTQEKHRAQAARGKGTRYNARRVQMVPIYPKCAQMTGAYSWFRSPLLEHVLSRCSASPQEGSNTFPGIHDIHNNQK